MGKRVAVIGAGPAGLATTKELLEEGHEVVCFERGEQVGGVFGYQEEAGVVWESCRLTSSRALTGFSDYPIPERYGTHLRAGEFAEYLAAYAGHFGVTGKIRFGTSVEAVVRSGAGWRVRVRDENGEREEEFDAVAVCSGVNQHPHLPVIPGQEGYPGEVIHGSRYRRPEQVTGKRVLVIGGGESGAEIAAEASGHARETVLSLRRGVAVVPRLRSGVPRDYTTSRLLNSPAHWIYQTRNPADNGKRTVYKMAFFPFLFVDKALVWTARVFWEYLPLLRGGSWEAVRVNWQMRKFVAELLRKSGGTINEQFRTKSDEFVRAAVEGRCRCAAEVERFEGERTVFTDGTDYRPEMVIYCTGFQIRMPFLDGAIESEPRYLYTIHPGVGASLGFIGFVRPAGGAVPPLAELQARWFALLQSSRVELPGQEEMERSIQYWREYRAHFFRAVKGRLAHLVEYTVFCDELAARIGCKPRWTDLRKESGRFRERYFEGPFVAAQYRLVGPHAKPEVAREVIENLPVMHPWPDRLNLRMRWMLSRWLHRWGGEDFRPKLQLGD